jgi:hypothetical protein
MSDYKISKEDSTEVLPADSAEVHESSSGVSETVNGTEIMESTEVVSGSAISADVHAISNDVHIIMVFVIVAFVMSCMRAWRKNATKGV